MYENDYMYAIERNDDYLAHYGIKGMRWGVRKAIERGNQRALGRQYRKAQKKLAKLEKRANNGAKYAKRAAALGAGAAVAGGAAALGTARIGNIMRNASGAVGAAKGGVGKAMRNVGGLAARSGIPGVKNAGAYMMGAGRRIERGAGAASKGMYLAGRNVTRWGQQHTLGKAAGEKLYKAAGGANDFNRNLVKLTGNNVAGYQQKLGRVSNNTIARIGAGAVGAGLLGAAGYNAYRAATTKKAAAKAARFRSEMNKAFKGTQYANGGAPRQGKKRRRR